MSCFKKRVFIFNITAMLFTLYTDILININIICIIYNKIKKKITFFYKQVKIGNMRRLFYFLNLEFCNKLIRNPFKVGVALNQRFI